MEEKMMVPLVAGLFSLLGAFAGAWLARRTDYLKWLMQNRSEAFAAFLQKLFDAQDKAINEGLLGSGPFGVRSCNVLTRIGDDGLQDLPHDPSS